MGEGEKAREETELHRIPVLSPTSFVTLGILSNFTILLFFLSAKLGF